MQNIKKKYFLNIIVVSSHNSKKFSGSTKFEEPKPCGTSSCDYGTTCIDDHCLCQFDCKNDKKYYQDTVCGSDGNTYRSECQLRQYSCRIQKEIVITKYDPCTDAPRSIYGQDSKSRYRCAQYYKLTLVHTVLPLIIPAL